MVELMELNVAKLHGIGNDYVVIEDLDRKMEKKYSILARGISNINFGIGSDGILVVNKGKRAKYHMRVFNPDGSEAEMSGNGARIFTTYLFDKKMIGRRAKLEVGGKNGGKTIDVSTENGKYVSVGFGKGEIMARKSVEVSGKKLNGFYVSVGNPHFVVFVPNEKTAKDYMNRYGPLLEHNKAFNQTNGANIEFAYVKNRKLILLYVWERGAGVTLACGSGACATALAAYKQGIISEEVDVRLLGGILSITLARDGSIVLKGPVGHIFSGRLYIDEVLENKV
jgi:diaminopimelate epimerase